MPTPLIIQTLTGSGNFIVPQDVYYLEYAEGTGGAGGGGRGVGLGNGGQGAGGGAGARTNRIPVYPGQIIAYQQGIGGTGAPLSGSATAGTDTFFGSYMIAKGSAAGANNSASASTGPTAASCTGDIKVAGGNGSSGSGGSGGGWNGGAGASVGTITGGAGGLRGADNPAANGGGPGGTPSGGGGGGRNVNNSNFPGGDGGDGVLNVAWYAPEIWS